MASGAVLHTEECKACETEKPKGLQPGVTQECFVHIQEEPSFATPASLSACWMMMICSFQFPKVLLGWRKKPWALPLVFVVFNTDSIIAAAIAAVNALMSVREGKKELTSEDATSFPPSPRLLWQPIFVLVPDIQCSKKAFLKGIHCIIIYHNTKSHIQIKKAQCCNSDRRAFMQDQFNDHSSLSVGGRQGNKQNSNTHVSSRKKILNSSKSSNISSL